MICQRTFERAGACLDDAKSIVLGTRVELLTVVTHRVADHGDGNDRHASCRTKSKERGSLHFDCKNRIIAPLLQLCLRFPIGRIRCPNLSTANGPADLGQLLLQRRSYLGRRAGNLGAGRALVK